MIDSRNRPRFAECQVTPASRRTILLSAAVLPGVTAAVASVQPSDRDAALITLCARHPALIAAVNASPIDFDVCPAWQAYEVSRDAIHDARPVTLAGMRAKALAAKAEALSPDGTENPGNCPAETWSWDLVNDLLRLTGGAA